MAIMAGLSLALSGCAAVPVDPNAPPPTEPAYYPYITPAAQVAVAVVLGKATDDTDRQHKAQEILLIADAVEAVTSTSTTGADLSALVARYAGNKTHWIILGTTIGFIYDQNVHRLGRPRALEVLHSIALGLKSGATPFAA